MRVTEIVRNDVFRDGKLDREERSFRKRIKNFFLDKLVIFELKQVCGEISLWTWHTFNNSGMHLLQLR